MSLLTGNFAVMQLAFLFDSKNTRTHIMRNHHHHLIFRKRTTVTYTTKTHENENERSHK